MKKVLHHIHSKPSHIRDRYIWIIAAVAIVLLLTLWAIVGNGRKSTPDQSFFESFNQGVEEGKNTFDQDSLQP